MTTTTALTASPVWHGDHHGIEWPCYCGWCFPTKDALREHIATEHPTWEIIPTEDDSPNPADYHAVQHWAKRIIRDSLRHPTPVSTLPTPRTKQT